MKQLPAPVLACLAFLPAALASSAIAQVPDTLRHYITPPPAGAQIAAQLGRSVAVDEGSGLTAAGAPDDDYGDSESGVVKVFNTTTGALLHMLVNPSPGSSDLFGHKVALGGTLLVAGAPRHDREFDDMGIAYVYNLGGATPTVPVTTLENPSPAIDDTFGISVAVSGTRVVVGAFHDDTGADETGSAYVYDLSSATPSVPVVILNNPGPAYFDEFATSVAISGTRVVVGVPGDDTGAAEAGIAYVYDVAGPTPAVPVATLNNPSPTASDRFGISVAVSGTRVVVGADLDDTGANGAGIAYVYDLAGATPTTPVTTLRNPAPASSDYFGNAVAISGTRVVVGAFMDDAGASNAGSTYVFDLTSATPTVPVAVLNNPTPAGLDNFGHSVAVSGTRVAVGAPLDDTGALNAGTVYTYNTAGSTPTVPVATLNHPGPSSADLFGTSVAISGTRLVTGVPWDDTGAFNAGSAYVYDLSSATPTVPVVALHNPSPAEDDDFGRAVAISGTRVVVGAPRDDTGAGNAGLVYVYDLSSPTPSVPMVTLQKPGSPASAQFGQSVAMSGTRLVVGANFEDTGATNSGSVWVFNLDSATPSVPVVTLNNPAPADSDEFGYSVAISGTRVVVGAWNDDAGAQDSGGVFVYDISGATPTVPVATLANPSPAAFDRFGRTVAVSGTRVVVGASLDDAGAQDSGSAWVYDLAGANPTVPAVTLLNPTPAQNDYFGSSVAVSGMYVVVGTPGKDTGVADSGSAWLYDLGTTNPAAPVATLSQPAPSVRDDFGSSVAVDGTTVAVGIPGDATPQWRKGAVRVFGPGTSSPPDYVEWSVMHFGAPPPPLDPNNFAALPQADPDGDGHQNLVEFAVNTSPVAASRIPFTYTRTPAGLLQVAVTVRNSDPVLAALSARGEGSATLSSFSGNFAPAITDPVPGDGYALWTFTDQPPPGANPRRFLRARFSIVP